MAPRILIFSIAIGVDYSFDIKSGFSIAPAFSLYKNFDIASVTPNSTVSWINTVSTQILAWTEYVQKSFPIYKPSYGPDK